MLTKKEQLTWNKPNKSKYGFGTKKYHLKKKSEKNLASDEDKEYLNFLKSLKLPCFVCGGYADNLHHVKLKSTDKKNHKIVIPLCSNHHTGFEFSPHGTPVSWRKSYPIEMQNLYADRLYKKYLESKK